MFGDKEIAYLTGQRIGRLATVTPNGQPHVVPTRYHLDPVTGVIKIGARILPGRGQQRRYRRNIESNPDVAFVVDDIASTDPWIPRGVSIRGHAEVQPTGGEALGAEFGPAWVKITPTWISSWGIHDSPDAPPHTRSAHRYPTGRAAPGGG